MKSILLRVLAALVLFGAVPSQATTVYVRYTGVAAGTDTLGLFGNAGTIFTDAQYVADYVFDATVALPYASLDTANAQFVYGGSHYGIASPSYGATLTIGAYDVTLTGGFIGEIYSYNYGGLSGSTGQISYAYDSTSTYLNNLVSNHAGSSESHPAVDLDTV